MSHTLAQRFGRSLSPGIVMKEADVIAGLTPAPPPVGLTIDQQAIWCLFESQKILALKKNYDYGSSVFQEPVMVPSVGGGTAILVRMSDKICRIRQLLDSHKNLVNNESVLDTFCDLGTYAFLYVIWMSRYFGSKSLEPRKEGGDK